MNSSRSVQQKMTPEVKRGAVLWIVKAVTGLPFLAAILFLSAGRWDWGWGWLFIGLLAVASIAHVLILIPNPALLNERSKGLREKGAPTWDQWITSFAAGLLPLSAWILSGLDLRFGWSSSMPIALYLGGMIVFITGWAVVLWATGANAFFSTTVASKKSEAIRFKPGDLTSLCAIRATLERCCTSLPHRSCLVRGGRWCRCC